MFEVYIYFPGGPASEVSRSLTADRVSGDCGFLIWIGMAVCKFYFLVPLPDQIEFIKLVVLLRLASSQLDEPL